MFLHRHVSLLQPCKFNCSCRSCSAESVPAQGVGSIPPGQGRSGHAAPVWALMPPCAMSLSRLPQVPFPQCPIGMMRPARARFPWHPMSMSLLVLVLFPPVRYGHLATGAGAVPPSGCRAGSRFCFPRALARHSGSGSCSIRGCFSWVLLNLGL